MNTNKVKKVKEFSASWCAPCRAFAPTFKKISEMDEFSEITFEAIHLDDDEDHDVDIANSMSSQFQQPFCLMKMTSLYTS